MAGISAVDVKSLRDRSGAGMMDCKRALADAGGDLSKASDLLRERGLAKAGKRAGRATSEGNVAVAFAGPRAAIIELGCETDFVAKTDAFHELANEIAEAAAGDSGISSVEDALEAPLGDSKVGERIAATIAKVGENIALKRVAVLEGKASIAGGYVHAGGRLGVIVALEGGAGKQEVQALTRDLAMHIAAADPTPMAVDRSGLPAEVVDKERELLAREARQSGKPEPVIERIIEGRLNKYYAANCLLEQAFVKDPDRSVGDLVESVAKELSATLAVSGFVRFKLGEVSET